MGASEEFGVEHAGYNRIGSEFGLTGCYGVRQPAGDIFQPDSAFKYVQENLTLREFIPIMTDIDQQNFPVVNSNGEMTGIFSINDVRDILVERDLDNLLIMKEIANDDVPWVTLDDNLGEVLRRFTENEVDTLPVVERSDTRKLLGMVRRRDVIRSYYDRLNAMRRSSDGG